jgi:hypothetical protein
MLRASRLVSIIAFSKGAILILRECGLFSLLFLKGLSLFSSMIWFKLELITMTFAKTVFYRNSEIA